METTNPRKAGELILNNLSMFNEAVILMEEQITVKIFEIFQEYIEKWNVENDWESHFGWFDKESNLWISPNNWYKFIEEENIQIAKFDFGYENDESNSYDVADLCNCGQSRLGFFFAKGNGIKPKLWKQYPISEQLSLEKLEKLGFKKHQSTLFPWFIPVTLNNTKLAAAYEKDDFDEAMQPLHEALATLLKAKEIFDPIVEEMKKLPL